MSDYRPDLAALTRSDRLLDALAICQPVEANDPEDQELAALLADWRDELRWPPATGLVSEREAVAALQRGRADRRRAGRGLRLVGSVAAAVLALGGFGALVGTAQPGEPLYGVHTMLFGEPPSVHDDRVTLAAKTELEQVQQMISQGQWDEAQTKLAAVSTNVQTVNDEGRKQDLIDQVNQLNAKVATHDPNATAQPGAAAATTTTPVSVPPTSADQTTSTTPSATSSTSDVATTTATTPAATSTAPNTATTATPTSSAATPSTTPSASPTSPSPTSTPPSSVVPTATTTEPTTSAR